MDDVHFRLINGWNGNLMHPNLAIIKQNPLERHHLYVQLQKADKWPVCTQEPSIPGSAIFTRERWKQAFVLIETCMFCIGWAFLPASQYTNLIWCKVHLIRVDHLVKRPSTVESRTLGPGKHVVCMKMHHELHNTHLCELFSGKSVPSLLNESMNTWHFSPQ